MRTILFLMVLALSSVGRSIFAEQEANSSIFISYCSNKWIMQLQNGSKWEVYPLREKPELSWGDWWDNTTPPEWSLDESYFVNPLFWNSGDAIVIDESPKSLYKGYNFLLYNQTRGQRAFAKPLSCEDALFPKRMYTDVFYNGFEKEFRAALISEKMKILIDSDNQIWEVFPAASAHAYLGLWEGISQGYYNQPDPEFLVTFSTWEASDIIKCYSSIENCVNKFLIENSTRGQFVYASTISLVDYGKKCEQIFIDQYNEGYNAGYKKGYDEGYNEGYDDGDD